MLLSASNDHAPEIDRVADYDVAVLGVPFDSGTSYRPGARFGPMAVRQASRHCGLTRRELLRILRGLTRINLAGAGAVRAGDAMRRPGGDDPSVGQVPPLHALVAEGHVAWVGEFGVGALPVPDLPAGVPGIGQDRGDRAQRPPCCAPVRVPARVGGGRARHPGLVQRAGDPRDAVPSQALREYPPHHVRGLRVWVEVVCPPSHAAR